MTAGDAAAASPWLQRVEGGWRGGFDAMASPCEVLVDDVDESTAQRLLERAQTEALRIEQRYSRYRADSVVAELLAARGQWHTVDEETAGLLDFAAQCHALSQGLFDISSGVLRQVWRFDGSERVPTPEAVAQVLPHVGWHQLQWRKPQLWLPEGMELDFGGIGKEYAVDRVLALLRADCAAPMLVNFGGDLACTGPRAQGQAWAVGIEQPDSASAAAVLQLHGGALATSGDARRYLLHQGQRLGHVLNPHTGWPILGAPRSVTVAASTCVEAGMLATMALLQGPGAATWLAATGMPHALITAGGHLHTTLPTPSAP